MAVITWLSYIFFAFVIMPSVFRVRCGRWPFTSSVPPRNRYDLVECMYGALIVLFTIAILADAPEPAAFAGLGIGCVLAGVSLQTWAVLALGCCWRIGQDESDAACAFVRRGPYRLLGHPIYVSMCLISTGQAQVMGWDWRSIALVLGNVLYGVAQGRAESRRWQREAA